MKGSVITKILFVAFFATSSLPSLSKEAPLKQAKYSQSVMGWCFKPIPVPELIDHCVEIGIQGIEGIPIEYYPLAQKKGLNISLVTAHKFDEGPTSTADRERIIIDIKKAIDLAVSVNCEQVIVFSGYRQKGLTHEQMTQNCISCWKSVVPYAEKNGITIVLEHLNSRDNSHPMKGHPGYFANDVDHCFEMIRAVNSPNFKLLFDIYHVSVMNGDIIRRIRQNIHLIGHIHTAGNPGRGEIDDTQEIYYPAIMKELVQLGYQGYIAHEFIPTNSDKIQTLKDAYKLCDL